MCWWFLLYKFWRVLEAKSISPDFILQLLSQWSCWACTSHNSKPHLQNKYKAKRFYFAFAFVIQQGETLKSRILYLFSLVIASVRMVHSRLTCSISIWHVHSRLKISILGLVFLWPVRGSKPSSIEKFIPYWNLDSFNLTSPDFFCSISGPSGSGAEIPKNGEKLQNLGGHFPKNDQLCILGVLSAHLFGANSGQALGA